ARCSFECLHKVGRWRDLAFVGIEIQTNVNRLPSLEPRSFTVALPQWNARRATDRRNRAAIRVALESDLDRYAYSSEYTPRIEGEWNEADRTVSNDRGSERFRSHRYFACFVRRLAGDSSAGVPGSCAPCQTATIHTML